VKDQPGGFPVLRLTALRNGTIDLQQRKEGAWTRADAERFLVRAGDFFVSRGNGSLDLVGRGGLVSVDPDEVAFPDTMIRIRPDIARIESKFLALAWTSPGIRRQIESSARTTAGIYKVNQTDLGDIAVPLPPPDEQRRIVDLLEDHLSRLDAADRGLSLSLAKLDGLREQAIRQAITAAHLPGRVGPALRDEGTNDDELPSLPVGWSWERLGDVADVVGGVTKDAKKQDNPSFEDVPYLRVANVQRGYLNLDTVTHIRVDPAKARALSLETGDVLLNEGGDRDKLARGWVWEGQIDNCIHQNHVFRARIHEPRLDPYFLSWTTNTFGGRWAERNGKQSVNLASISLSMIRRMPVIVPPAGVASDVVSRLRDQLESYNRLAGVMAGSRTRGVALRRALLAAAFDGRLTNSKRLDERLESVLGV
jgi:type I restriction enzyme S subunit